MPRKADYLKPINLSTILWLYADDKGIEIVTRLPATHSYTLMEAIGPTSTTGCHRSCQGNL